MQKFNLDNELNRIQNKTIKKNSIINKQRILLSILILMIALTYSLNKAYSGDFIFADNNPEYNIHVDVVNGYETVYDLRIDQPSFKMVIDSDYIDAELDCNNSNIKYDSKSRLLYGSSINNDVKCVLQFDEKTVKSNIAFNNLKVTNDNNGVSRYYSADAENNYISINYMLFRIIRVNGDGSLRVILNSSLDNSVYGYGDYTSSNALAIANNWFNNNLSGYAYAIESDYDLRHLDSMGTSFDNDLLDLESLYYAKVGFISANEVILINGSNKVNSNSYLYGNYFTSNETEDGSVWAVRDGVVSTINKQTSLGIRPVINIRYGSLSGDGTINNPYMIEE